MYGDVLEGKKKELLFTGGGKIAFKSWKDTMKMKSLIVLLILALAVAILTNCTHMVTGAPSSEPQPGADGLGDPLYPLLGNGGYDAQHCTINLSVDMDKNFISGSMTMDAQATQDLSALNLDFVGHKISEVVVDDVSADFSRNEGELTIVLPEPLGEGDTFTVMVTYRGTPGVGLYPDAYPIEAGWVYYGDGVAVYGAPSTAAGWFPANEHPQDKATYSFRITVAKPFVVAASGLLVDTIDDDDTTTYVWEARDPMASYAATVNIGEFEVQAEEGPNGVPIRNYFASSLPAEEREIFTRQAEMIEFFSTIFGRYPFEVYGSVLHDISLIGAQEMQTLSVFFPGREEKTVAHELAHQWFGNSVSVESWNNIWLNEGFADYAEVLWAEHTEGPEVVEGLLRERYRLTAPGEKTLVAPYQAAVGFMSARFPLDVLPPLSREQVSDALDALFGDKLSEDQRSQLLDQVPDDGLPAEALPGLLGTLDFELFSVTQANFNEFLIVIGLEMAVDPRTDIVPPGSPVPDDLQNRGHYERGGLTLHASRLRVGDEAFFDILRTYFDRFKNGNASIAEFIAVAEEVSGQDLNDLFNPWLYDEDIPDMPELGFYREDFLP